MEPTSGLERALKEWFKKKQLIDWGMYKNDVQSLNPLWFERIASIVSKYSLVDLFQSCQCKIEMDIPDMRQSFERVLCHVFVNVNGVKTNLSDYMIANKLGYPYETKQNSVKYEYTLKDR
jgi:hypothetical protein